MLGSALLVLESVLDLSEHVRGQVLPSVEQVVSDCLL